jgi:hypothetical protein
MIGRLASGRRRRGHLRDGRQHVQPVEDWAGWEHKFMALAPVDYGPQVAPDDSGLQAKEQAGEAVFRDVRQLGSVVEGGAQAITQGILHTQALKATAAVKERQASTLSFIDSNPYVPKAVLQQRMRPEDYEAWHAGLATEYQDKDAVPMFTAAGALFDSEAQQAREEAGTGHLAARLARGVGRHRAERSPRPSASGTSTGSRRTR